MTCPKCKGNNVQVQVVSEAKRRGFFTILLYIILIAFVGIGWVILFFLLRGRKTKTVNYAICQNCGHRWEFKG